MEEFIRLCRERGLGIFIRLLEENEVDAETFNLIADDEIKEMVPKIGGRIKFTKLMKESKALNEQMRTAKVTTETQARTTTTVLAASLQEEHFHSAGSSRTSLQLDQYLPPSKKSKLSTPDPGSAEISPEAKKTPSVNPFLQVPEGRANSSGRNHNLAPSNPNKNSTSTTRELGMDFDNQSTHDKNDGPNLAKMVSGLFDLVTYQSALLHLLINHNKIPIPDSVRQLMPDSLAMAPLIDGDGPDSPANIIVNDQMLWHVVVDLFEKLTVSKALIDSLCMTASVQSTIYPDDSELERLSKTIDQPSNFCKIILFKLLKLHEIYQTNVYGRTNSAKSELARHIDGPKFRWAIEKTMKFKCRTYSAELKLNIVRKCVSAINGAIRYTWNRRLNVVTLPAFPDGLPQPRPHTKDPFSVESDFNLSDSPEDFSPDIHVKLE